VGLPPPRQKCCDATARRPPSGPLASRRAGCRADHQQSTGDYVSVGEKPAARVRLSTAVLTKRELGQGALLPVVLRLCFDRVSSGPLRTLGRVWSEFRANCGLRSEAEPFFKLASISHQPAQSRPKRDATVPRNGAPVPLG